MRKRMALLATVAAMIAVVIQASPAHAQDVGSSAAQYGPEGRPPAVGIFRVTLDGEMPEGKDVYVRSADISHGVGGELLFVCTTNRERIEADPEFNEECQDSGGVNEAEFLASTADTVEYDLILTDDYGENEQLLASDSFVMEMGVIVDVYRDLNGGTVAMETSSAGHEASQYGPPSPFGPLGEIPGTLRLRIDGELPEGVDVHMRVTSDGETGHRGRLDLLEGVGSGGHTPCEDGGGIHEAVFLWPEGEPFEYEIVLDDDGDLGNTTGYEVLATGSGVMEEGLILEDAVDFGGDPDTAAATGDEDAGIKDAEATSGEAKAVEARDAGVVSGEETRPEESGDGPLDALASFLRRFFE